MIEATDFAAHGRGWPLPDPARVTRTCGRSRGTSMSAGSSWNQAMMRFGFPSGFSVPLPKEADSAVYARSKKTDCPTSSRLSCFHMETFSAEFRVRLPGKLTNNLASLSGNCESRFRPRSTASASGRHFATANGQATLRLNAEFRVSPVLECHLHSPGDQRRIQLAQPVRGVSGVGRNKPWRSSSARHNLKQRVE